MLEALKVIVLGIVEGITEWLPISSTGHLILVEEFIKLKMTEDFMSMFNVVIQLGAILAVVVIYFHKLNPFSDTKTHKQKMLTLQLWVKVLIASVPAAIIGLLFDDFIDEHLMNYVVVAITLILYGIAFIVVEKRHEHVKPAVKRPVSYTHLEKLFSEIAPKYTDRNGGYTRIVKIGQRKGDAAMEVLIELV